VQIVSARSLLRVGDANKPHDLVALARILGHQNPDTKAGYTQRTGDPLAEPADRLNDGHPAGQAFRRGDLGARIGQGWGRSGDGSADSLAAEPARRSRAAGRGPSAAGVGGEPAPLLQAGPHVAPLLAAGEPFVFRRNTALAVPDGTVDEVVSNNVPIVLNTWLGPRVQRSEVHRMLRPGGHWRHNGVIVFTKP
jgi:hypothetical protein